jgi:hypothetical protein
LIIKEKVTQVKGKIVLFLLGTALIGDRIYEFPLFDVRDDGEIELLGIIQMERIENMMIEIEIYDLEVAQLKKKPKSALQIEFEYFYLPYPVSEEGERPMYPLINVW